MNVETLLIIIAVLLFMVLWQLSRISSRLKEMFPGEREQDYKWALEDPIGHWETHQKTKARQAAREARKKEKHD